MWLGVLKICRAVTLDSISEQLSDSSDLRSALDQEFLGTPLEQLNYYEVEVLMNGYLPMK